MAERLALGLGGTQRPPPICQVAFPRAPEEDIEAVKVWLLKRGIPLNLAKCGSLTSGGEHRWNEMSDTMDVSLAKDLGVTITSNFKPSN